MTRAYIFSFHTPEYVERVRALSVGNGGEVGDETNIAPGGYDIAALAAGGVMAAVGEHVVVMPSGSLNVLCLERLQR